ncbi:hypothetical protein [Marinicella meishanensis]|uniref:hypothetical protein n=1 Tax=Marinicella meishanensis TaxID=2873263 RepID=UPI001CBB8309|nr:hypothetical protein [Marinicella sp. NBU2979]
MMIRLVLLLSLCGAFAVQAQQFVIHEYEKLYPNYGSTLRLVDFKDGEELATFGPIESRTMKPAFYDFPQLDHYLLLTDQKRKKTRIYVLERDTLAVRKEVNIERLTIETRDLASDYFFRLVNDGKSLAVVLGKPNKKELVLFDTLNYKQTASFPINSKYSVAELSDDGRFVYFKDNNFSSPKSSLVVVDLAQEKVLPRIKHGRGETVVHSFKNYLLISRKILLSEKDTTRYAELKIYDLKKDGAQVAERILSDREQQFVEWDGGEQLLIANRTRKSPRNIEFYLLGEQGLNKHQVLDVDVKLNDMWFDAESKRMLLSGKENMALVDANDWSVQLNRNLPFNAEMGLLNSAGDKAFLVTNSGTRMHMLDVANNRLVNDLGIGSSAKRAGKILGKSLLIVVSSTVGGIVPIPMSRKGIGMLFSHQENKLFVHNRATQDITVFDAVDFEDKYNITDMKHVIGFYKYNDGKTPTINFTDMTTTLVDAVSGEVIKEIEHDELMGFESDKKWFVVNKNSRALLYSSETGEKLASIKSPLGKEAFYVGE